MGAVVLVLSRHVCTSCQAVLSLVVQLTVGGVQYRLQARRRRREGEVTRLRGGGAGCNDFGAVTVIRGGNMLR